MAKVQLHTDFAEFEYLDITPPDTYDEKNIPNVEIDDSIIEACKSSWENLFKAKKDLEKAYEQALEKKESEKRIARKLGNKKLNEAFPICCAWRY